MEPRNETEAVQRFVDWLRKNGYFLKKVDTLGNERFELTSALLEQYRLDGGFGRAAAEADKDEALF